MSLSANKSSIGFNLVQGIFTIDNQIVTGWSEDAEAWTTPEITILNSKLGADGQKVYTPTGMQGGEHTISLLANSLTVTYLNQKSQQNKTGLYTTVISTFTDPRTGSVYNLGVGYILSFKEFPSIGAGQQSTMVYKIDFPNSASIINNDVAV